MRFQVEQHFDAPVAAVLSTYTDPAFYEQLIGLAKIGEPQVVEHRADAQQVVMAVHYRFTADLPGAALAVIDPDKLTWIEESTYDLAAATCRSKLLPDHYPDRLTASATSTFTAAGAGTVRRIDGDLRVRMALVGGKVERAIVSGLQDHLGDEARVANRYMGS